MSNSVSITRLSLDPELLSELFEKLPSGISEQLTHNRGKQTEALVRNEKENRLLPELLPLMRVRKYGPASEFDTVCGSLTRCARRRLGLKQEAKRLIVRNEGHHSRYEA